MSKTIYQKISDAREKTKAKEHYALVCPFHPAQLMAAHEVREKNGTITPGFHCPKCFCQNGISIPIPGPEPKK